MKRKPLLSTRERLILLIYGGSVLAIIFIFLLIGIIRDGLPVQAAAPSERAEIAVLVPTKGDQAELGNTVASVVQWAVAHPPQGVSTTGVSIEVYTYHTGDAPNGAASAAAKVAKDPATLAIIGPLNARQTLAAAEVIAGQELAILTPASTAPSLIVGDGVYRIPAADDQQAEAIVKFISQSLDLVDNKAYVIAESSGYINKLVSNFNRTSQGLLQVVGTLDLSQDTLPSDLAERITSSEAEVVVFFGNIPNAKATLEVISSANLDLPFIASDAVNAASFLPLPENLAPVYYTSPILNLAAIPVEDQSDEVQALASIADLPFAKETVQATWLVLAALSQQGPDETGRQAVWKNLERVNIRVSDVRVGVESGQAQPTEIYVYQVGDEWADNLLVARIIVR